MSRTLKFGYDSSSPRIASRIDTMVIRRNTRKGYDAAAELSLADHARQVAYDVSPGQRTPSLPVFATYASAALGTPFGRRQTPPKMPANNSPDLANRRLRFLNNE